LNTEEFMNKVAENLAAKLKHWEVRKIVISTYNF
jgi:hypothetical protein